MEIQRINGITNSNKDYSFSGKYSAKVIHSNNQEREPDILPSAINYGIEYFTRKTKNVQNAMSNRINEKIGEIKITKLFTSNGVPLSEIYKNKDFIKRLARLDYKNIEAKYTYFKNELQQYLPPNSKNELSQLAGILDFEELTEQDLDSLHKMARIVYKKHSKFDSTQRPQDIYRYIISNINNIQKYENFDMLSTQEQSEYVQLFDFYIDDEFINALKDTDSLMKFGLIKDVKRLGSSKPLKQELKERMKNKPISAINVNPAKINKFLQNNYLSIEFLKNSIGNVDLSKYKQGLPLKYSRDNFISDFNTAIKDLTLQERKEIFDYYQFNIDSKNDIIKFPVPSNADTSSLSPRVQAVISKTKKYVNDFVLNNEIILDKEDKEAEKLLNDFISVFPEFISVIGKIQHRGDSIDHHTLENLQRCLNNPKIQDLTEEEIRVLFFSVMFHDIAKKQELIDEGHQRPSAMYAKEIIKKVPISMQEKEQIYNLTVNSHWLTEGKSDKDLGAVFRHNNEFKIAQIMAKADSESSGFEYAPSQARINAINGNINKIKSNGIPLFADNLPEDTSKFPTDEDGVKYLDFTDKEADLSEYGFPIGTKVKDLNLLSHNSSTDFSSLTSLCDDSKEICLSSSFLNASDNICTNYNLGYSQKNCNVILYSSNADIALAGVHVCCTGGKRGFEDFKDFVYGENNCHPNDEGKAERNKRQRSELPNYLKEQLNLSDDEYFELYKHLEKFSDKRDIQSVTLSSGRTLDAKTLKDALNNMQEYLIKGNEDNTEYKNEVVVFQPKIQAVVMNKNKFLNSNTENSEIKKTAKENNIPVILI